MRYRLRPQRYHARHRAVGFCKRDDIISVRLVRGGRRGTRRRLLAPVRGDKLISSHEASCQKPTCDQRSGAVAIACGLGIGALALSVASLTPPAYGQSADLVLCDRLAADPTDP